MLADESAGDDSDILLLSKDNPFQVVSHDKNASVIKEGFLQRKLHADVDGKRSESGLVCLKLNIQRYI